MAEALRLSVPVRAAVVGFLFGGVGLVHGARADRGSPHAGSPDAGVPAPFTATAVTFEAPLARALPDVGRSLVAGDFDGDGTLDAAVLVPGALAVVLDVDGAAAAPIVTPLPAGAGAGDYPEAPRVADIDGDGFLDVVIAGAVAPRGCGAMVLRGLGDGSFEIGNGVSHPPLEGSAVFGCQAVEVADFDGNGSPDIAVLYSYMPPDTSNGLNGAVDVFLGSGAGALEWASRHELTGPDEQPFMAMAMALADFDGDGALDLAFSTEVRWLSGPTRWRLQTLLGDGTGQLSPGPSQEFTARDLDLTSVHGADVTGDGHSDLVFGTALATGAGFGYEVPVLAFFNQGNATFTGPLEVARDVGISGIQSADYTGDGDADVLIAGGDDRLTLLPGDGLGGFGGTQRFFVSGGISAVHAADVDDDGRSDLLLLDAQGQLLTVAGQLRGKPLALPPLTRPPEYAQNVLPTLVDLDRDGTLDMLSATYNRVDVLLGTGSGSFVAGTSLATSGYPWRAPVLDLNDDGLLDLVVADGPGFSGVFGTEGGGFTPWSPPADTPLREITASAWGDVDADGDVDLVVVEYVRDVELYLNDGAAHFTLSRRFPTGTSVNDLALVDFDQDGQLDLFIGATFNCSVFVDDACVPGQTVIRFGDAAGGFERTTSLDLRANRILTVDVTGDGRLDLLAPEALFVGRGDGTFESPRPSPSTPARDLVLADLNGDGHLDLLSTNDDAVYVAEGDGTGDFAERHLIQRPGYGAILAVGDLTGSSLPDLLTSRTTTLNDIYEASELIVFDNTTAVGCGR